MSEIDIALIKKKSLSGIVALTQRTFLLQVTGFIAIFLLGIFLNRSDFGIFGVVSSIIAFLSYFSDIGLAGALIQKKEDLTQDDLGTTFTIQQLLVGMLVVLALVFSNTVAGFYRLEEPGMWLYRALIFSFFLSSLKTIPSVILERKLDFNTLVIPQILETLCYNLVTVVLAWKGFGIWSFTWGTLVRAVVGLVAMYMVAPWKISLGINTGVAKRLFRFGIPFQWNSFIALAKDDLLFLFLGKILPLGDMGFIYWAKKWAEVPLRLIMENIVRVTFPAFSRLQHDTVHLKGAIEKTLFGISVAVFPLYAAILFFMRPFIDLVPKYDKWEPALLSFYMFGVTSVFASLSTPLTVVLNAIGRIRITLMFMTAWTILTWVCTVLFITLFGFNGFSLALLVVSLTIVFVVFQTKRFVSFSFWDSIRSPLFASAVQSVVYVFLLPFARSGWPGLILSAALGGILYVGVVWKLERKQIKEVLALLRRT